MKKLLNLTSQNYKPKIVSDVKYSTALKATVRDGRIVKGKQKKSGALSNLQFLYSTIVLVESNKREKRKKKWKI